MRFSSSLHVRSHSRSSSSRTCQERAGRRAEAVSGGAEAVSGAVQAEAGGGWPTQLSACPCLHGCRTGHSAGCCSRSEEGSSAGQQHQGEQGEAHRVGDAAADIQQGGPALRAARGDRLGGQLQWAIEGRGGAEV